MRATERELEKKVIEQFYWPKEKKTNYSGIGILEIDGDRVLLECYSVHSASNSRIIIIIISIIIPARERC